MELMPNEILFEGRISMIEQTRDGKVGWVDFHGARILVNLSLISEAEVGDRVLVQGRFALSSVEVDREVC